MLPMYRTRGSAMDAMLVDVSREMDRLELDVAEGER
jgi:hypothetical protein